IRPESEPEPEPNPTTTPLEGAPRAVATTSVCFRRIRGAFPEPPLTSKHGRKLGFRKYRTETMKQKADGDPPVALARRGGRGGHGRQDRRRTTARGAVVR